MARRQCHRSKPKKKLNRYNPNAPDWASVHLYPWERNVGTSPVRLGILGAMFRKSRPAE